MGLDVSRKPTKCPNLCFPAEYVKDVWECTSYRLKPLPMGTWVTACPIAACPGKWQVCKPPCFPTNSVLFFASHGNGAGGAFVDWDIPLVNRQLGLRMGNRDGRPLASLVAPHPSLTQRRALHISHLMMQRGLSEQSKAGFTPGPQPSVEVPWMVSLPSLPATQPSPTQLGKFLGTLGLMTSSCFLRAVNRGDAVYVWTPEGEEVGCSDHGFSPARRNHLRTKAACFSSPTRVVFEPAPQEMLQEKKQKKKNHLLPQGLLLQGLALSFAFGSQLPPWSRSLVLWATVGSYPGPNPSKALSRRPFQSDDWCQRPSSWRTWNDHRRDGEWVQGPSAQRTKLQLMGSVPACQPLMSVTSLLQEPGMSFALVAMLSHPALS